MKLKIKKEKIITFICGLSSIVVLWGVWELSAVMNWQYTRIFPPPSHFLRDLADNGFRIGLGSQAAGVPASITSSFFRVFVGLGIGFVCALFAGMAISMSKWVKRFIIPVIGLLAPIAPIAWIPLALVVFGIGNQTAIFIVFMGVFFILTIATVKAIETVPEHLLNVARTLGAKRWQLWCHVTAIIMNGRNLFDNNLILLGMCLIGVSGFIIDNILKWVQKKFFWWDIQQS